MEPNQSIRDAEKSAAILLKLETGIPTRCQSTEQPLDARKCIYISKQTVFEQALVAMSLKLHASRASAVGNDQVLGSVCIDVPAHGDHPAMHQKTIFGDYKLTEEEALESAKLAALLHLQKAGIVLIDDINLAEVKKHEGELSECQHKLLAASSWAMLFQERAELLQAQLNSTRQENTRLLNLAKVLPFTNPLKLPSYSLSQLQSFLQSFTVKDEDLKFNVLHPGGTAITSDLSTPPSLVTQGTTSQLVRKERSTPGQANARKKLFKN